MGEKRKFFQFQNICRGSQPSTENTHPCQKGTDPSPWAWQPAVRAAMAEGGDGRNLQGEEHHPGILAKTSALSLAKGYVCGRQQVWHRAASGRACLRSALCSPALHTHSLLPWCFPHLHRVKMHTFILQIKLCFLKKPLTRLVNISTLGGGNAILFFLLDLSSDPYHPLLRDTRKTFLHQ